FHARRPELTAAADGVTAVGTELASSDCWPEPLPLPDTVVRIDIDEVQMLTNAEASHPILADARPATARLAAALDGRRAAEDTEAAAHRRRGWKAGAAAAVEQDG